MQRLEVRTLVELCAATEDCRRALEQLRLPLRDLVRMDVEALGQLRDRQAALDRGDGHLCFECGEWFRRARRVKIRSFAEGIFAFDGADLSLIRLFD